MLPKISTYILSGMLALNAKLAFGALVVMGGMGVSAGTLTKADTSLTNKGFLYSFQLSWYPEFSKNPWPILMGVQAKQLMLNSAEDSVNKRSNYNLYGGHLGFYSIVSPTFRLHFTGEYYAEGSMTTLSNNSVLLNSYRFKYSTWTQYTGQPATGVRMQLTHDKIDGQFTSRNSYRSGIGISVLQQSFDKENIEITTSSSDLAPEKAYSSAEIDYRILLINIDIFIGLTF